MNTKLNDEIYGLIKAHKEGLSFLAIQKGMESSVNFTEAEKTDIKVTLHRALNELKSENRIKMAKNPNGSSNKLTFYKIAPVKPRTAPIRITAPNTPTDSKFKGTAGEYAVMSELLYLEFNVNIMTVDKGQDIIAHKDGKWYFIQVKTTYLTPDNHATWQIKRENFNKFYDQNSMRYVLVLRCKIGDKFTNKFFSFSNSEINTLTTQGLIKATSDYITIKIKFEGGFPILYNDKKEQNASPWESFDSIVGRQIQ